MRAAPARSTWLDAVAPGGMLGGVGFHVGRRQVPAQAAAPAERKAGQVLRQPRPFGHRAGAQPEIRLRIAPAGIDPGKGVRRRDPAGAAVGDHRHLRARPCVRCQAMEAPMMPAPMTMTCFAAVMLAPSAPCPLRDTHSSAISIATCQHQAARNTLLDTNTYVRIISPWLDNHSAKNSSTPVSRRSGIPAIPLPACATSSPRPARGQARSPTILPRRKNSPARCSTATSPMSAAGRNALAPDGTPPIGRLRRYLDVITSKLEAHDWARGCMIGNLSLETAVHSEPLRLKLVAIFERWREPFAACIAEGQAAGEITDAFDADRPRRFPAVAPGKARCCA